QCDCSSRHLNTKESRFCQFCGYPLFSMGHWASSVKLEEGENIGQSWYGTYVGQIQVEETALRGKHLVRPLTEQNGMLMLTDQRILWTEQGSAPNENYLVNLKIDLEDINDVSTAGTSTQLIS